MLTVICIYLVSTAQISKDHGMPTKVLLGVCAFFGLVLAMRQDLALLCLLSGYIAK